MSRINEHMGDENSPDLMKLGEVYMANDSYRTLVRHHIESYNDFIDKFIPRMVAEKFPLVVVGDKREYTINITDISMSSPTIKNDDESIKEMMPIDARYRNLTYSSYVVGKLTQVIRPINGSTEREIRMDPTPVTLGEVPVMLQSKYCKLSKIPRAEYERYGESLLDTGGYFVVSGSERVLIPQERQSDNRVMCHAKGKIAEILSTIDQRFNVVKSLKVLIVPTKHSVYTRVLMVKLPFIEKPINVFILFRAYGFDTDESIMKSIMPDIETSHNSCAKTLHVSTASNIVNAKGDTLNIRDTTDAFSYIKSLVNRNSSASDEDFDSYVTNLITRDVLPHVGVSPINKGMFLAYMCKKLLDCECKLRPWDDRDSFSNKRVDGSGPNLMKIYRTNFNFLYLTIKKKAEHILTMTHPDMNLVKNIIKNMGSPTITKRIKTAMLTGNWSISKGGGAMSKGQQGASQVLDRLSLPATLAHLRHIQSPTDASSKVVEPRYYNLSSVNMICPDETPESSSIGLTKNLALTAHITIDSNHEPILKILHKYPQIGLREIHLLQPHEVLECTRIFVNGNIVGMVSNTNMQIAYYTLLTLRRHGVIAPMISIAWDRFNNELLICTDGGRFCFPALIVNNTYNDILIDVNKVGIDWDTEVSPRGSLKGITLFNGATIEYLDAQEVNTCMVCESLDKLRTNNEGNPTYRRYTHCIIHPLFIKGMMSLMIPFANHNMGSRNCFQTNMGKQAMGKPVTNMDDRFDNITNELVYPMLPLCETRAYPLLGMHTLIHGYPTIVATQCFTGYNMEDSVITCKDSLKSGMFNSVYYRTYEEVLSSKSGVKQQFEIPETSRIKYIRPTLQKSIDQGIINGKTGIPNVGARLEGGDVIIAKFIEPKGDKLKDVSVAIKAMESGVVDKVIPSPEYPINIDEDGNRFVKARLKELRVPIIGDKFATTSAQKGTNGLSPMRIDMPMSGSGVSPELIFNPHGMPTRMTVSQQIECYLSQIALFTGKTYDATPFTKVDIAYFQKTMLENGGELNGEHIMYDGQTGEQIRTPIFMGPTFYQRLKHMVDDKIQARDKTGPIQLRTHQPSEGKSRNGGLRLGEMERDCFIAHGVSHFLKERYMECSDIFKVYIGEKTGTIMPANPDTNFYMYDNKYDDKERVFEVQMPYTMTVLIRMLGTCGIDITIDLVD